MSFSDIGNSRQIITIDSVGCGCTAKFYEKDGISWNCIMETYGAVGKNGVSDKSREGDYYTPQGIFSLGFAFGTEPMVGLGVEYRQINADCYWVDDPGSPLYNQWVESKSITWNSAESLIDYPEAYKYSVVINYNNDPVVAGKGSAIFLHCMSGSFTAGCVAIPEGEMLFVLKRLNAADSPLIIIE